LISTPATNNLYREQASSPVTSRAHQACSAMEGFTVHATAPIESPGIISVLLQDAILAMSALFLLEAPYYLPSTRQGIDRSLSAFENKTSSLLTKSE